MRHFFQIKGMAMGSTVAPSIANLYMTALEEDSILTPANPFYNDLILYKRFIDNILIVFRDAIRLECFVHWMNEIDTNINFTQQSDEAIIPFLDTYIFCRDDNTLAVKPFRKSTDMNTYLHFESFHPSHLRKNLLYGQFLNEKEFHTRF